MTEDRGQRARGAGHRAWGKERRAWGKEHCAKGCGAKLFFSLETVEGSLKKHRTSNIK